MKNFPNGDVQFFWLMSVNAAMEPATKADIKKWDDSYDFGDYGRTLVDDDQAGFKALFKDAVGTDGAMILKRGTIITETPSINNAKKAIEDALNQ